jgi:hypothetical protein
MNARIIIIKFTKNPISQENNIREFVAIFN